MLAVNNSKNPVHDAKSSAKYSKVGEDAGSCCNHSKNPGEVEGGVAMMCSFFDELPSGRRVAHLWSIFLLVPRGGVLPPPVGPSPCGGDPPPNFPQACEACRPGGGARGLTMAALPKQAYTLARMLSLTPGSLHMSCVAFVGLKFVVPGWCPGPDDGSLAETNSKWCGQEM